ncbi:MAG: U32 family peptidase [Clostridia bacterium]
MLENKKVELLSPAGNIDSFNAAINAGADAVYMGINKFNARVMAENFNIEEYINAISYAHKRGVKVYLTLNTLLYDQEIKDALEVVLKLYSKGLDAVILQDLGMASLIRKLIPNLSIHASTQMSVYSLEQVKYLEKMGFKRVVLARELTIEQIKYICINTSLEIEVFIHGALCVSLSGQCLMSQMIGKRSANRGSCAQPCRMKYSLVNSNGTMILKNKYILSKKDVFGLDSVQSIIDAGVNSLKIEGRNKSMQYVYLTTSKYRKYLDDKKSINRIDEEELLQIFNRSGKSDGYLYGVKKRESISIDTPKNTGIYLGKVLEQNGNLLKVKLENNLNMHDGIEIYSNGEINSTLVTCIKDENMIFLNTLVENKNIVWIGDMLAKVNINDKIYKTSSSILNSRIKAESLIQKDRFKTEYNIDIFIKKESKVSYKIFDKKADTINITTIDCIPEVAQTKPITKEKIIEVISKNINLPYVFKNINIELDKNLFLPISSLNKIKNSIINNIDKCFDINIDISNMENKMKEILQNNFKTARNNYTSNYQSLYIYKFDICKDYIKEYEDVFKKKLNRIYIQIQDVINIDFNKIEKKYKNIDIYISLPNMVGEKLNLSILKFLDKVFKLNIKGFLLGSLQYFDKLKKIREKKDINLVADYSFNITNKYSAAFLIEEGFNTITPMPLLDEKNINILNENFNIELIDDFVCVMSSRYCILGTFVSENINNICNGYCKKDKYYLVDSYGLKYDIICDSTDCIMRLIRPIHNNLYNFKIGGYRNCII